MEFKRLMSVGTAFAMLIGGASTIAAQAPYYNGGNPGIVTAASQDASQLPEKATKFIDKHFKNVGISKCEKYFAKGKYEVELVNGIDLEFDSKGNILEIDAPGNTVLPATVVKDIIPSKAYERLSNDGFSAMVESIEFNRGKVYEIELNIPGPDTFVFDINGVFLAIED